MGTIKPALSGVHGKIQFDKQRKSDRQTRRLIREVLTVYAHSFVWEMRSAEASALLLSAPLSEE